MPDAMQCQDRRPALPEADVRPLAHSPIELVVFELLLLAPVDPLTAAAILRIQECLAASGRPMDRMEPAQRRSLHLKQEPGQEPEVIIGDEAQGWTLSTADESVSASIFADAIHVQVNGSAEWNHSLRPTLTGLLEGLANTADPPGVRRVGLRYVNRLTDRDASSPQDWKGRVENTLLGPVLHPDLGKAVLGAQQQIDLAWEDGARGVLRHGPFKDGAIAGAVSYLLDIDISDPASGTFDVGRVLTVADGLHLAAVSVFQAALTTEYLEALRGEA
ncbi:TIGR04255 family protein [Streptomyces sp. NPDC004579]|uniref:TIGR04255 family protein n=1 Tax=Streptomyces sp. NPDC004579 TaxID=3154667 RepID=UPI0033A2D551